MTKILNGRTTQILNNLRKGVGSHSVLITFALVTLGVGGIIYFAQKEIPKAKEEVREIRANKKINNDQKKKKIVKSVVKNTWKTMVIAIGTILLVTSTSAITAANTAATVANLSNSVNLANHKVKSYEKAVNDIPDENIKEEVKRNVAKNEQEPIDNRNDKHWWVDKFTGFKIKATYKQMQAASDIINLKIQVEGSQMLRDFYIELEDLGAIIEIDEYPDYMFNHGWYKHNIHDKMGIELNSCIDDTGETEWYIVYNEPASDLTFR